MWICIAAVLWWASGSLAFVADLSEVSDLYITDIIFALCVGLVGPFGWLIWFFNKHPVKNSVLIKRRGK
jgi:hypothetical protein